MNPNKPQYTTVKFNKDATDAVYKGMREVTEAVATTLGPLGRNVLIDKGYETSIIHDGVKVSLSINPEDPFERNGANVIKEATKRQRDEVGDGTTAVAVLTQAIIDESLKATATGINPMTLRRGLESGADKVVKKLSTLSTPVKTLEQKIQIATISAEDPELGRLVAETVHKIGKDGILTVEESKAAETYVEHQEGMQIDKGYAHGFMVTDAERQIAVLEDCHVLITDYPLTTIADIGKFLDQTIFPNTKKVLFISPDIGVDFMQVLLGAKMSGQFLGVAMRAPGLGTMQTEMLQDLCALTGAKLITKEAGMKFDDQPFEVLGSAKRIVLSKISTIITNGAGHKDDILQRIQVIRKQLEDDTLSDYDHEQLKARLGKLTDGVAVIKVGGMTEVEMKERKERAEDAKCSTQAAVQSGFVPGGEISYLACLDVLDESILGEKILKDALKAPFRRLVENAGYDSGEILERLRNGTKGKKKYIFSSDSGLTADDISKLDMEDEDQYLLVQGDPKKAVQRLNLPLKNAGFDVIDGKIKDMVKSGIIDATAIPMTAVKTAVSVSIQLASLGAAVVLNNAVS